MANKVSNLKFNNVTYDLADESSRAAINNLEGQLEATRVDLNNMRAAVGSPLTAATTSAMTDTSKIYVYTGTTTTVSSVTFTAGNWYYHDGTKWQLGGTYNETALETDTTLTVSGAAADAKVTGDKVTELKSDLSDTDETITAKMELIKSKNLSTSDSDWTSGYYVANGSGNVIASSGLSHSSKIRVNEGDIIRLFDFYGNTFGQREIRSIAAYDANGDFAQTADSLGWKVNSYTVPSGIREIIISAPTASRYMVTANEVVTEYEAYISPYYIATNNFLPSELVSNVESVSDSLDNAVKRVVSDAETVLTISKSDATQYVINNNGATVEQSANYHYSLDVNEGEVVSVKRFYYNRGVPSLITPQKMTAVCAKSGSTIDGAKGLRFDAQAESYTVPSGIDNIIISFVFTGTLDNAYITRTVPNGQIDYYPVQTVFESPCKYSGALTANQFQKIGDFISVDNYILTCNAKIENGFTSLKIGGCNAGGTIITSPYVEVTPTQLKMYSNTDSSHNRTESHGLTIANDLQVFVISNKGSLTSRIILQSNGQRWESEQTWRLGSIYYGYGTISETNISSFSASVSVIDLFKPVWVCGDSWVTFYDERWYGQAIALNLVDFLHSGHSGEGSKDGLVHLKTLLSMYTPKMIVWLYGMNDSDTDNSTPNANWTAALNELETICENRTIDLVLATIPTTPTINNNAKNAAVIASGYRYVDEVAAMGADSSGNWISGYQSSDGNHTTEAGARALLAQVISDVPEICIK